MVVSGHESEEASISWLQTLMLVILLALIIGMGIYLFLI
jgi:hypothetical protein